MLGRIAKLPLVGASLPGVPRLVAAFGVIAAPPELYRYLGIDILIGIQPDAESAHRTARAASASNVRACRSLSASMSARCSSW